MSSLVSCKDIAKAFGVQELFYGLNLVINPTDRVGLIGPNGSGKSTLLKIISGLEEEDSGTVLRRKNLVTSYLAQEDRFIEDLSLVDNLLAVMEGLPRDREEKLSRVRALLSRAMFIDQDQPVAQLSGGWRKRLSICRTLAVEPDLLVLDEPTNHLDIEGIIWLEHLLSGSQEAPSTFVVVSHDRRFLETCTNRTVELSKVYPGGSFQVDGTYSTFLERREEFLEQQNQVEERLRNKVRRETQWLRRGPKARTGKAKYRTDEAARLQDELQQVQRRRGGEASVAIDFEATGRKTKKLLEARNLGAGSPEPLFSGLDLVLSPGVRLGVVGANGCGKSTLINTIGAAGAHAPEHGSIRVAEGLSVAVFRQDRSGLDPAVSLRRTLAPEGDGIVYRGRSVHVVSWAKRFLFRPDQLDTPVGRLSGGEQARILIAELMRQPADVLLLDEPTNDLDIGSLDVLEEGLLDFGGAVVLVTHDRYLLDRVCTGVLGFCGSGRVEYFADYQQWLDHLEQSASPAGGRGKTAAPKPGPGRRSRSAPRLTYLEQQEYEQIEDAIMAAEEHRDRLEGRLEHPGLADDPEELQRLWQEAEQARSEVERLYARWDELEDKQQSA